MIEIGPDPPRLMCVYIYTCFELFFVVVALPERNKSKMGPASYQTLHMYTTFGGAEINRRRLL